jgi:predicted TIM-barrel fold metal-dependent hydrolase
MAAQRKRLIIDGHLHCGPRKFQSGLGLPGKEFGYQFERLKKDLEEIGVSGAVLLPFPDDIYRKPSASKESAKKAHEYILDISKKNEYFFPFYFVWSDFIIPDNLSEFKGIKWHRHFWSEPETYDYSSPNCDKFIQAIRNYNLPVIIEESFENTKLFCDKYPDLKVIIPHVGLVSGGGMKIISEFKNKLNVYIETSLSYPFEIVETIRQFGADRVIFGSDTPYSSTKIELFNLLEYNLIKYFSEEDIEKILSKNILKLMHVSF